MIHLNWKRIRTLPSGHSTFRLVDGYVRLQRDPRVPSDPSRAIAITDESQSRPAAMRTGGCAEPTVSTELLMLDFTRPLSPTTIPVFVPHEQRLDPSAPDYVTPADCATVFSLSEEFGWAIEVKGGKQFKVEEVPREITIKVASIKEGDEFLTPDSGGPDMHGWRATANATVGYGGSPVVGVPVEYLPDLGRSVRVWDDRNTRITVVRP